MPRHRKSAASQKVLVGAGFFSSLGKLVKRAVKGAKKVGVSKTLGQIGAITGDSRINRAAAAARQVGLGKKRPRKKKARVMRGSGTNQMVMY